MLLANTSIRRFWAIAPSAEMYNPYGMPDESFIAARPPADGPHESTSRAKWNAQRAARRGHQALSHDRNPD
jgi:hypothetical protein